MGFVVLCFCYVYAKSLSCFVLILITILFSLLHILTFGGIKALESGQLAQGGVVTEGSAGSTAISLATVAPAYGCTCHVVIPDDAAIEKVSMNLILAEEKRSYLL